MKTIMGHDADVEKSYSEQRESKRSLTSQAVVLQCGRSGLVRGVVCNISDTGAFVQTSQTGFSVGDNLSLCVVLKQHLSRRLFQVQASVVRMAENGIALEYIDSHFTIKELTSAVRNMTLYS